MSVAPEAAPSARRAPLRAQPARARCRWRSARRWRSWSRPLLELYRCRPLGGGSIARAPVFAASTCSARLGGAAFLVPASTTRRAPPPSTVLLLRAESQRTADLLPDTEDRTG